MFDEIGPNTLVCTKDESTRRSWEALGPGMIVVHNAAVVREAVWSAQSMGRDVRRVIFDDSFGPGDFLEFLAEAPADFRGDVIVVRQGGGAFLSSMARLDGRVLYELQPDDLALYFLAHFDQFVGLPVTPEAVDFAHAM